jgi:hypothetical protein
MIADRSENRDIEPAHQLWRKFIFSGIRSEIQTATVVARLRHAGFITERGLGTNGLRPLGLEQWVTGDLHPPGVSKAAEERFHRLCVWIFWGTKGERLPARRRYIDSIFIFPTASA